MTTNSHMIISLAAILCGKLVLGTSSLYNPSFLCQCVQRISLIIWYSVYASIMNWKHKWSQGCVLVFLQSITAPTISSCQLQYKVPNGYLNLPLSSHFSRPSPLTPPPSSTSEFSRQASGARLSAFDLAPRDYEFSSKL